MLMCIRAMKETIISGYKSDLRDMKREKETLRAQFDDLKRKSEPAEINKAMESEL